MSVMPDRKNLGQQLEALMTLHPDFHSASSEGTPSHSCLGSRELTEAVLATDWNKELSVRVASFFSRHRSL